LILGLAQKIIGITLSAQVVVDCFNYVIKKERSVTC
jgi:hypothetical protein